MDTYYMDGCKGEEPEVLFFDKIYVAAMTLVDLDNTLQENIDYHLISEENLDDDIDDYTDDTTAMEKSYHNLINFIKTEKISIEKIEVFENNNKLQYALIELFDTYYSELSKAIPQLLKLIKSEDLNKEESEKLNSIYPSFQSNLDDAINKFYISVEEYANKYNIELS